jgi:hypothetical protein
MCAVLNEPFMVFVLLLQLSSAHNLLRVTVLQQCAAACVHWMNRAMPTIHSSRASLIVAVQLSCTHNLLLRAALQQCYCGALLHCAILNRAMPTIHSSCTSLFVAVQLSCTQSAACCSTTSSALLRNALNEQPPSIHWLYSYRNTQSAALARQVLQRCAAMCITQLSRAMPTIHSSCTSLFVAVRLSCTTSAACSAAGSALLLHAC